MAEFKVALARCGWPIRTVVEAGSRNGKETRQLATHAPGATVHCFEPNPAQAGVILERIKGLPNVRFYPFALSDQTGTAQFWQLTGAAGMVGSSAILPIAPDGYFSRAIPKAIEITVPAIRVDDWASMFDVEAIDAAWLDVQGAELLVLEGFGHLLDSLKVLYTERLYQQAYTGQAFAPEVDALLTAAGFRKTWESPTPPARFTDALFVREQA